MSIHIESISGKSCSYLDASARSHWPYCTALALSLSGQSSKLTADYLFRATMTGALHMGISANTRYQLVNGGGCHSSTSQLNLSRLVTGITQCIPQTVRRI
jgi:hypothetical protein